MFFVDNGFKNFVHELREQGKITEIDKLEINLQPDSASVNLNLTPYVRMFDSEFRSHSYHADIPSPVVADTWKISIFGLTS